ncbi:MAG: carotenoid oxygenase family protein [Ilumatobacteraceae bacterium]
MVSPIDPSLLSSKHGEVVVPAALTNLIVRGAVPAGLSGRLLGIRDGIVHEVHLHPRRAPSYRCRRVHSDATGDAIVAFGGSILIIGNGSVAHELGRDLEILRAVDLAGQSRGLTAHARRRSVVDELHVLAVDEVGTQAHVAVSAGALTRRTRSIVDAPSEVTDLAVTRDGVVFVADGFVGVTAHHVDARISWIATGVAGAALVHAADLDETVVALAITPKLERWTIDGRSRVVHRELLDATPHQFACVSDGPVDGTPQFLWTVGEGTFEQHDLSTASIARHHVAPHHPADLVRVADSARRAEADRGWILGLVHPVTGDRTELLVLDALDVRQPALAQVRIPREIPTGLRTTWIPSTNQ